MKPNLTPSVPASPRLPAAHAPAPCSVYVDGPNIDAVLFGCVLDCAPDPDDRPRWDNVRSMCRSALGCDRYHFVLNGNRFDNCGVFRFRRSLRAMGWAVDCPQDADDDPVDQFIRDELTEIAYSAERRDVTIVSHDHGYAPYLRRLLELGRAVSVIGFYEELAPALLELERVGARILDLEYDLGAFRRDLGRPYRPRCA